MRRKAGREKQGDSWLVCCVYGNQICWVFNRIKVMLISDHSETPSEPNFYEGRKNTSLLIFCQIPITEIMCVCVCVSVYVCVYICMYVCYYFADSDLQFNSWVMDETALSLGTIDVSYLSTSAECSISRCKHSSEEWVSKNCECYWPYLSYFFFKSKVDFFLL